MKAQVKKIIPYSDFLFTPLVFISALILKFYRKLGSHRLIMTTKILKKLGVFPIVDHYYEPLFNDKLLHKPLKEKRNLPGINLNEENQLKFLNDLNYSDEFKKFVLHEKTKSKDVRFEFGNDNFEQGDADFLFNFIRAKKPSKVIEIGCGSSTKIINKALEINKKENGNFFEHICIEPFEHKWLDNFDGIKIIRQKLEELDISIFQDLKAGDFLFIDSSHIIRPQGDVLKIYLEIIPILSKGVNIHVHDIFTPRDYLESWVVKNVKFWNEQYLLESMLSNNKNYEIIASLNHLKNEYYNDLKRVCPFLSESNEPGSFYFRTM